MNKFIISIALVVAVAGVASANSHKKHHKHADWEEEEECCSELRRYRPHHNHHLDNEEGEFFHGPGGGFGHGHGHGPAVFPGHGGHGHGHGHGSGHGLGHGSGHGLGHGSGHGLGHGSGHGLGHGSGHGLGHGSGHGLGHGSGHGLGHGSGHGLGHGSGSGLGGHGGKFNHGGLRPHKLRKGKHFGKHQPRPFPLQHRRPHGAIGGGAIGGLRGQENHLNGLHSNTHLGSNDVIEGHKGNLKGGHASIELDQHRGDTDEIETIRKHQVVNSDKTFVNDKTSGINDVEGFRNTDSRNEDSHLGADIGGFSGSEAGGSIKKSKDFDQDLDLVNSGDSSIEAAGAKGAGAVF